MRTTLLFFLFVPLLSMAQLRVFDHLDDLKQSWFGLEDEMVFVKGHSYSGDGGEGFFIYKGEEDRIYEGMFLAPASVIDEKGRWMRVNYDNLRVNYFGAHGDDTSNDTAAIQKAIDFGHKNGYQQIEMPVGTYLVDSLILRNGTKIRGHFKGTVIQSASDRSKESSEISGIVKIANNAVTNVVIENLTFDGNGHEKVCFYIKGVKNDDIHAGLWKSTFKNIEIKNFNSHGIFLKGGVTYSENSPNQFLSFENIRVKRNTRPGANSLRIEGQNAQLSFLNCTFDSQKINEERAASSWNIFIKNDVVGNGTPALIKFDTCTIQNAIGGFSIQAAENINIEGCWFENIQTAIRVGERSQGVAIESCRFANASGYGGTAKGYILYVAGESMVTFERNVIAGKYSGLVSSEAGSTLYKLNNVPKEVN